ncbi:MAG: hypothetical protein IKZ53_06845 [Selenomonadaceae bacterium]|nr:hypothetical protein [Selenomonadaceae bacterium]
MDGIKDLEEILRAMQQIGNAWHEKNLVLISENETLLEENKKLRTDIESLRRDLADLSEKIQPLIDDMRVDALRKDIITELAVGKRDEFQKDVRDELKDIRDKLTEAVNRTEPTGKEIRPESNDNTETNSQSENTVGVTRPDFDKW